MNSSILSKVLLLLGVCLLETPSFVLGSGIAALTNDDMYSGPPNAQQQRMRDDLVERQRTTANEPLPRAARNGKRQDVQFLLPKTPWESYYDAIREAICAGHNDIAEMLAFSSRKDKEGNLLRYRFFWWSILRGELDVFKFFIAHGINVSYISKPQKISGKGRVLFDGVPINAWSFLLAAWVLCGESESLIEMRNVLASKGLQDTPPLYYSGGGGDGGCCEVY
jgi:hypothetical protein